MQHIDPELQAYLGRTAFFGLVSLLTMLPRGEDVDAEGVGAILRLIAQCCHHTDAPGIDPPPHRP